MRYRVYGMVSGTKYLGCIEADNEMEAMLIANDLPDAEVCLCNKCVSECDDAEINEIVAEQED